MAALRVTEFWCDGDKLREAGPFAPLWRIVVVPRDGWPADMTIDRLKDYVRSAVATIEEVEAADGTVNPQVQKLIAAGWPAEKAQSGKLE